MVNLYRELSNDFIEVEPMVFYRKIFPVGELDKRDEFNKGKFTGIAVEFTDKKKSNGKQLVRRYSITDDLSAIEELLKSEYFTIISPISYVGKARTTENARVMYAFAIEIDNIKINEEGRAEGYYDLIHQMKKKILPMANYIIASGNGVHLYYLFDKPLALYPNVVKSLIKFKRDITPKFWNRYITTSNTPDKIQNESAFQGFRLAGGVTKNGDRTRIFEISKDRVSIDYLNSFVFKEKNSIEKIYKNDLTLEQAKIKYPEWYDKRIIQDKEKGSWTCKRDLYDWWLRKIKDEASVGHRYYCLMILAIYAIKSGISYEELEQDCFSLLDSFDEMSNEDKNRFTKKDIVGALQSFEDKELVTYPINSIIKLSGIPIKKNKRNYRKRDVHIRTLNNMRKFRRDELGEDEYKNNGRPKGSKNKINEKELLIKTFLEGNDENLSITEISKKLNVSRTTVYKYLKNKE